MLDSNKYDKNLPVKYRELQRQLKQAHLTIKSLQDENIALRERLAQY